MRAKGFGLQAVQVKKSVFKYICDRFVGTPLKGPAMAFFTWARWLKLLVRPRGKTYERRPRRLSLEQLETRLAPATFIWSGAGPGNKWSTGSNWVGGVAPSGSAATLDDLVFDGRTNQRTAVNDLTGATFNSITISASNYLLQPTAPGANGITLGNPSILG